MYNNQYDKFYEILFEHSELAIFIFEVIENRDNNLKQNYDYKFILTNTLHQKLTGISLNEIQNKTLWELNHIIPIEDLTRIKKKYDECVLEKKIIDYEEEIIIKNKTTYWFTRLVPVTINNKVQYVIGMSIDITSKKSLEIEIENYYNLLTNLLNSSPVGIGVVDKEYRLIYFNNNFLKIWNLSEKDVKNNKLVLFKVLKQVQNRKKVYPKILKIVKEQKKGLIKYLKLNKKYIQMEIYPLKDKNNEIRGYIGIYIDRTKDYIQEKQLIKALKEAQLSNKSKTEFLANISHELRTPLTTIMGLTELLENQVSNELLKFIKMIQESASYLKDLIEDILDLSSIELRTLKLNYKPFQLNKPIDLLVKTYQIHCNQKNIDFYFNTNFQTFPIVKGDEKRLYQIINNLLSNALKFTSIGYISLSLFKLKETDKEIFIEIEVKDTGIGIPEDKLPYIFERFKKFDEFNINPKGVGIGLSLVKEFVQMMNGTIEVFSKLGEGTTFKIHLTLEKADLLSLDKLEELTTEELIEQYKSILENKRILIAEDTFEIQLLLRKFLSDTGLIVDIVSNGLEVLEKLKKNKYDLILLDLRMPVMDGIATFLQIDKKIKEETPIAALTAHAMEEDIKKTKEIGFTDHITKPIKRKELLIHIIKILLNS
ncbi:MAG: hypothetical protein KatS3mg129_1977 [Leptospiraceae bacterium]|nr:MAG: hypothetical protein KatS3mg129_1977 [Leptospiraceae bacterium]